MVRSGPAEECCCESEDHDRQRCRPEYEAALLEDLEWLGFTPDQPSRAELRQGPSSFRQSDNQAAYESASRGVACATSRVCL